MFLLTILILSLLAVVNYRIGSKKLFYPPVVFCSIWAADLILIWLAGDFFYPLSPATLFIFSCGGLTFSLGSWLTFFWPQGESTEIHHLPKSSNQIISILVLLIVAAIPFGYHWMTSFASGYDVNFLMAARFALLDVENEVDTGSVLFNNLATLSIIVAMIAFCEDAQGKKRSFIAFVFALAMNLMTGGRAGTTALILSLLCIDWLKTHRLRWKPLMVLVLIFVITFGTISIYVQKGAARADASLLENIVPVVQGFVLYAAGGPICFDRVIRDPNIIPHNWRIDRFFLQTVNKLGGRFEVPSQHVQFVSVGPNSSSQNIYTFYFAYLDFGYIGMMGVVFCLGFLISLCYRKALSGSQIWVLVYSTLFAGLMVSIFGEGLFNNGNFLFKLYALSWLIYRFPIAWTKFGQFTRRAVAGDLVLLSEPSKHSE
jgi:oligosaccharide repeat unit polymerase